MINNKFQSMQRNSFEGPTQCNSFIINDNNNAEDDLKELKGNLLKQVDNYINDIKTNLKQEENLIKRKKDTYLSSLRNSHFPLEQQAYIQQSLYVKLRKKFVLEPFNYRTTHTGYQCKICQSNPIKGVRFECSTCRNYSLCETCYFKGINSHKHDFYYFTDMRKEPDKCPWRQDNSENKNAKCLNVNELNKVYSYKKITEDTVLKIRLKNTGKQDWPRPLSIESVLNESDITLFPETITKCPAPGQECVIEYTIKADRIKDLEVGHYTALLYIRETSKKVWFGEKIPLQIQIRE